MDELASRIEHALKREFGDGYEAHIGFNTPSVVTVVRVAEACVAKR